MKQLSAEIREEITRVVSANGGHLSSNLGVVELTIALHKVYDFSVDTLIFDVGHQSYTHKILTSRREAFPSIRTDGGLSGFPSHTESVYDVFTEGHAGAALSQAIGLVVGNNLQGRRPKVVALVGDGSITAGMALEAINNAGHVGKRFLVVLNDNEMSISRSVGAMANYLNRVRVGSTYNELKRDIRALLHKIPKFGPQVEEAVADIRDKVARAILPGQIFEQMGFAYFGPYDGHDIQLLCETFEEVEKLALDKPVLVHVLTEKGRGFKPAEDDPTHYHSAAPFAHHNGKVVAPSEGAGQKGYTDIFADALVEAGRREKRVVAITAAMPDGTGTAKFGKEFPDRFFDVAICEQHAVGMAAGLSKAGLIPVVAIYSTFLQRAYDQVFHDIAIQGLQCVFAVDRAGLVGADGPTHHGVYDISYLRGFPGMVLMAPADADELRAMLDFAIRCGSPAALRYPRAAALESVGGAPAKPVELGRSVTLKEGDDATIIAYGTTVSAALDAAKVLERDKHSVRVINARFAKPVDEEAIVAAAKSGPLVTVEEHALAGGFGSAVLEALARGGVAAKVRCLGAPDRFVEHGNRARLLASMSLDAAGIASTVKGVLRAHK